MRPPRLLLVDDDPVFRNVLAGALERRGFEVCTAGDADEAQREARRRRPRFAIVDLRMPRRSGLEVVADLHALDADLRIVVLTGYASIATAVEAIKLGATHYLTKPADADEILAAFERERGDPDVSPAPDPMSVRQLEWEHLQRVLTECGGNISAAARRLQMHRRTLQRKLKRPPAGSFTASEP